MHCLSSVLSSGEKIEAQYAPEGGMNLLRLCREGKEFIDPATKPLYEERFAGLGALIGPHFHHRKNEEIPSLDLSGPKYLEVCRAKGQKEPFSHGIARYVPWRYEADDRSIKAKLSGSDRYLGHTLQEIEGQDFELSYEAILDQNTLSIDYSFDCEKVGVIGLHYYYRLIHKKGSVYSDIDSNMHTSKGWQPVPDQWIKNNHQLQYHVDPSQEADFGFVPYKEGAKGSCISLETGQQKLEIYYEAQSTESAWQLYHPKDSTYVCLEPVSAHNPREPHLKSGRLQVEIKIF